MQENDSAKSKIGRRLLQVRFWSIRWSDLWRCVMAGIGSELDEQRDTLDASCGWDSALDVRAA
jgi:hypothetical protein